MVLGALGIENIVGAFLVFILGVLPHGILEIPAILLSVSAGSILCNTISLKLRGKESTLSIDESIKNGLKLLIFVCVPFLIIAGIIEGNITPLILGKFL